jgi:acyl-CoA reductase-like NAD-dependent aldehyde dehydrogenase
LDSLPLEIFAPATHRRIGAVATASSASVAAVVGRAREAQPAWARRSALERADIIDRAARILEERATEWSRLLAEESGKILAQSQFELKFSAALARGNATHLRGMSGELLPTATQDATANDVAWVRRVPLGVVAAVLPFNFPVELFVEKAAAALAIGNAVIVKPPEQDPLAVVAAVGAFHEAGVPADVLGCVNGGREVGAALCADPRLAAISLTGSTRAGLGVAAAPVLRKLHLELGGNDAAILCRDCDLDLAVPDLIFGRTLMNGQACASNKRIIVHRDIADELVARLVAAVEALKVGDPLDSATQVGPLISPAAAATVAAQLARAVGQGAAVAAGTGTADGAFFAPCVLRTVPRSADVATDDEIFGPVLTCIPFAAEAEAVSIANQSSYGLSGCVFSRDWARAMAIADQMESGGVVVNGTGNYRPFFVPFGGVKQSGLGREGLGFTMEELSQAKYTVLRRFRGHALEGRP